MYLSGRVEFRSEVFWREVGGCEVDGHTSDDAAAGRHQEEGGVAERGEGGQSGGSSCLAVCWQNRYCFCCVGPRPVS